MTGSRLNSDDGGVTSSDCDSKTRSRTAAARGLRQRKTIDVIDADLVSYRPVPEPRPARDRPGTEQSEAVRVDDVQPGVEAETARPSDVVQRPLRHREHDVKELRRRLKSQRAQKKCDEEHPQSSSDRDTVETRLDQLARFVRTIDYSQWSKCLWTQGIVVPAALIIEIQRSHASNLIKHAQWPTTICLGAQS